jgi:hypothetical protein
METIERKSQMSRKGEEGAALIMALLISTLVLALSVSLILATSVNSWNFTDATAEQQAYNAAENGIQTVADVLRYKCTSEQRAATGGCRIKPNPLYATTEAGSPIYEDHKLNKISFGKAVGLATSNNGSDASGVSRLSRVLTYSGTAADSPITIVGAPANYNAFNLQITDPDNTGSLISYVTYGRFYDHDTGNSQQITFGDMSGAGTRIRYVPKIVANLNVPIDTVAATDFGSFIVTNGATGPAAITRRVRFEIGVHMTVPYPASRVIRGYLVEGSPATEDVPVVFDSKTYNLRGSDFVLEFASSIGAPYTSWTGTPAPFMDTTNAPIGYKARMEASTAGYENKIQGTISPPEPARLRVVSTGFGPRGSRKTLEAIIQNNYFNGLGAPATLTMVGQPSASNGTFTFEPGNSNAMRYSGVDRATGSSDIIPPVGTTYPPDCSTNPCNDPNLDAVNEGFGRRLGNVIGTPANVSLETPPWLQSPAALDQTIRSLYETARNSYDPTNSTGRVFTGTQPTTFGDNATGTGITFCDGDCELGPIAGGGILVVTGQLTLHGNFNWHGLIIVTGPDGVLRTGGGHGILEGNIVVAPYLESSISGNTNPATGAQFLAPQWDTRGGGTSDIVYNSDNQNSGLGAISNNVLGVVEK